jgi:phosphohistidine swiveling domain-containing protein
MNDFIVSFESSSLTVEKSGGKGYNLSILARSGFPVPPGFIVTTDAYSVFIDKSGIAEKIESIVSSLVNPSPGQLENASHEIHTLFSDNALPDELAGVIAGEYARSGFKAVAVRSSATTEDLPDASFAGQQETYLNVIGAERLLTAVRDCMASLWTARAIGYRIRNAIPHNQAQLAVVVQSMIESEVSGVLFTADPLTGLRSRTVIEAVYGLGESLVSGLSEPDQYRVDTTNHKVESKRFGRKNVAVRGKSGGGVVQYEGERAGEYALADRTVLELAGIGKKIEALYAAPQDIEWAYSDGKLYILQARQITTIYPAFECPIDGRVHVGISFAAVQGMLDPISTLGQNLFKLIFIGGSRRAGFNYTRHNPPVLRSAGERLWIDITPMLHVTIGRNILLFLDMVEPSAVKALRSILDEPEFSNDVKKPSIATIKHLIKFVVPVFKSVVKNLRNPRKRQIEIPAEIEALLARNISDMDSYDEDGFKSIVKFFVNLPYYIWKALPLILPPVVTGIGAFRLTMLLSERLMGSTESGIITSRGVPHNVTTDMDLKLWEVACEIKKDPPSFSHFMSHDADGLARDFLAGKLPGIAQNAIQSFIDVYGKRGVGEIDIGRERWSESPEPVVRSIKSYITIDSEVRTPGYVYKSNKAQAEEAVRMLVRKAARAPGGFFLKRIVQFVTSRARGFLGFRELPKFYAVRMIGEVRKRLIRYGEDFVRQGILDKSDDLFHLNVDELKMLARGEARDWKSLVSARRLSHERESRRKQIPRLLLSDGRAFYEGTSEPASQGDGAHIVGSPVSPGVATGRVRIVLSPKDTSLLPGEVLVCPGTDPSWTPLFLSACALVMEVGGMMTHGAVVAREYGIPAVVGVRDATSVFKTGQLVSVNGTSGEIGIIEDI